MNIRKSNKNCATYVTDFRVRVYAPKANKKYWRISYVDQDGKLRDTTAKSEKMALDKSSDIEILLRNNVGNLPHNTINMMIVEYVSEKTLVLSGSRAEWGKKHTKSQLSIFKNHLSPIIGNTQCLRLKNSDLRKIVEACKSIDLSEHVASAISSLIRWGCAKGWLVQNSEMLLSDIYKIARRKVKQAGEGNKFVDGSEIPTHMMVKKVASCAKEITGIWWYELMFNLAAYSGLRFGEICDLDVTNIDLNTRTIEVNYQCLSVGGNKSRELPKWDTQRKTVFPEITPEGYKLKENLEKRIKALKRMKEVPRLQDGS